MHYSHFDYELYNVKVNPEKAKEVEEFFNNYPTSGFKGIKFEIGSDNKLEAIRLPEYYEKFRADEEFAEKLSEIIEDGSVELYFMSEVGEQWGYRVNPGEVKNLYSVVITDDE